MNQELIDYLHKELTSQEEQALRARLERDANLARELEELKALLGLMQRGEEIEPSPAVRARVTAAAERATIPPLGQRLRALPGLFRYRFRRSLVFRFAAVSLCAHLVLMAVLFQVSSSTPSDDEGGGTQLAVRPQETPDIRPDASFAARLRQRRLPRGFLLNRVGIVGQERAIQKGLKELLAKQQEDGTFGDTAETAYATLALLAEGDCSTHATRNGRAIRAAVRHLLWKAYGGGTHGAVLAVLVEDWVLSHEDLSEQERADYVRAILPLIRNLSDADEAGREGLALAKAAGFPVPSTRLLGTLGTLGTLAGNVTDLLARPATRLSATAVLARGRTGLDLERLRAWAKPLFLRAKAEIETGKGIALAVLTLQSPYRL